MKKLIMTAVLMPMMALAAMAAGKESDRDVAGGNAKYSVPKSALKFSPATVPFYDRLALSS